jgi:hypothetical protein
MRTFESMTPEKPIRGWAAGAARFAPVRFLSAVVVETYGKLLMALDCESGDPNVRQLEPAGRVAAADRRASSRRLSPRDGYGILP